MNDTITVTRAQMEQAQATLALMSQMGRSPHVLAKRAHELSYSDRASRRERIFMRPDIAKLFEGDSGRDYVGGMAKREWKQFAQPTASDVHVDAILTSMSIAYRNAMYIGPSVCPRVQVVKRSDKYFKFGKENLRSETESVKRAPGTEFARSGYTLSTDNYSVIQRGMEHAIPDEIRNNADNPLNPDRNGTSFATDAIDLVLENEVATLINTSANWTTNVTLSGTTQWSDFTNSDPVGDIETAIETVILQVAKRANTMVLGYQVFEKLKQHPDLLDRVKYTGTGERPAMVTTQMIAELFGFDQVLVGAAIQNTANEGQTDSLGFVWGKHAWIGYVESSPALETPSACYLFTLGRAVERYREEKIKSDIVRVYEDWDSKKVDAGAGYRLVNAVA